MKKQFTMSLIFLFILLLFPLNVSKAENSLANRLKGKLLLQVNQNGRIWYVNPEDSKRFEITFANALPLFEKLALGISDNDLNSIPKHNDNWTSTLGNRLKGKLLLQVEQGGRIWYVDFDGKRWEVTWDNLMELFESLALGITDDDLNKIEKIQIEEKKEERIEGDPSSKNDINTIEKGEKFDNPPINLINNDKWNIFIEACEKSPYISDCLYFNVYRNNEDMSVETYKKNKHTGKFEKYYTDYSARFDEKSVSYIEDGKYKKWKKDVYLSIYRSWYEYPSLKVNFKSKSYYIPINIIQEQLSSISYSLEEYSEHYTLDIDLKIKIREKKDIENNCLVKGLTNYDGKFYYTEDSDNFNNLSKFKCFSNEKNAQDEGYKKSYDN